jgi:TRAP-type transport system small permease protein
MMLKWMQWFDQWLEKVERGLAVGLYVLLISLVGINIVARNVWHMASHRLLELAPAVVLWLALVGATLALKYQRHIKIELALRYLPAAGRRMARAVTTLFAMGVCGVLAYASVAFFLNETALFGAWGWLAICFPFFFGVAFLRFGLGLVTQPPLTKEAP